MLYIIILVIFFLEGVVHKVFLWSELEKKTELGNWRAVDTIESCSRSSSLLSLLFLSQVYCLLMVSWSWRRYDSQSRASLINWRNRQKIKRFSHEPLWTCIIFLLNNLVHNLSSTSEEHHVFEVRGIWGKLNKHILFNQYIILCNTNFYRPHIM